MSKIIIEKLKPGYLVSQMALGQNRLDPNLAAFDKLADMVPWLEEFFGENIEPDLVIGKGED